MAIRFTSGMYNVIVLHLTCRAHSQHALYFLLHFTTHKASINDKFQISLDKRSRVRKWKHYFKLSGYYLRYLLQYKIPSKKSKYNWRRITKNLLPFNDFENPQYCGEKNALIKMLSLCYLQLWSEILFSPNYCRHCSSNTCSWSNKNRRLL